MARTASASGRPSRSRASWPTCRRRVPGVTAADGTETVGEPLAVVDRPVPGRPALTYSATAAPEPGADSAAGPILYRVDIEIRWSSQGATRNKTYRTLLVREVPFGERLRQKFVAPQ